MQLVRVYSIEGCNEELAGKIASRIGETHETIHRKIFPDGEHYLRVEKGNGDGSHNALLICSMYPNQNDRLIDILLAADALRRSGAETVNLVAPYLSYARQDRIFLDGEALSVNVMGGAFRNAGISRIYTVEAHSAEALESIGIDTVNVSAEREMIEFLKGGSKVPEVIAASDMGTYDRAKRIAGAIGVEMIAFEKERDRYTGKATSRLETGVDLKGKSVTLVDDIIGSGGTIANAATEILHRGASEVNALCVHALMVGEADSRLRAAGVKSVASSNSIENKFATYDLSRPISEEIKGSLQGRK